MDTTWTTDFTGALTAHVRDWTATIYTGGCCPVESKRAGLWELKTYKDQGVESGGADGWFDSLEAAKVAGEAFIQGAPERQKPVATCHWCGLPLDRRGRCHECGEQF